MSILARPRPATTFSLATLFLAFGLVIAAVISARVPNPETAEAATATIGASKDNTLYSESGSLSNGAGSYIFTGRTRDGLNRRTLIAFDIAGNVPAGSTITAVSLTLRASRVANNNPQTTQLQRLLADWGEGSSNAEQNEGKGAPAATGDATWTHRFYPATTWTNAGSDFSGTVSASLSVSSTGTYTWGSTPQMVADAQSWLDNPSTNFGWVIRGNELANETSKRFNSSENGQNPPALVITYTPPSSTPTATATPAGTPTATAIASPSPTPSPTPTPAPLFTTPLYAPPVLTSANLNISIDEACIQVLPTGPCTNMWTYDGTFPGPTIRRPTGQTTNVTFTNNLDPAAGDMTVHNHGNHSSPENDGRPDEYLISSGGSYQYTYPHTEEGANERGATQFYHDHRDGVTARNVWMGLAGFYILDDPAHPQTLPSTARPFDAGNQIPYTFNPNGVLGSHVLVNGRHRPYLAVEDARYRFRILNASGTRVYDLALTSGQPFTQIGTDSRP